MLETSMHASKLYKLAGKASGAGQCRFRREEPPPPQPSYQREQRWKRIPPLHETIDALAERDYLPAIWFIFSRAGCDKSAKQAYDSGARLTTPEEQAAIMDMVTALK